MSLGAEPAMQCMHNTWLKLVISTRERGLDCFVVQELGLQHGPMLCTDYFKATIHNQKFIYLPKTNHVIEAENYVLLHALFSSLKALRLCDDNNPGMDKIYYFVDCAHAAIAKSVAVLDDETLFGPLVMMINVLA